MKNVATFALCALTFANLTLATASIAQEATTAELVEEQAEPVLVTQPASGVDLDALKWSNRVLVVFADSPLDPAFDKQIELLAKRPDLLVERDIVVLTDTDPDAKGDIRTTLRPRGFALVIVDKDGRVMLRKPAPWDLREITRAVDKTPLRQQEIRDALSPDSP